jgi:hypothetical protein
VDIVEEVALTGATMTAELLWEAVLKRPLCGKGGRKANVLGMLFASLLMVQR